MGFAAWSCCRVQNTQHQVVKHPGDAGTNYGAATQHWALTPPQITSPGANWSHSLLPQRSGPVQGPSAQPSPRRAEGHTDALTPPSPPRPLQPRTLGVAEAGQAAVPVPPAEEAVLAALTAGTLRVALAAEAAVPVPRLLQEVPVKDALPGHPVAVTHWGEERHISTGDSR